MFVMCLHFKHFLGLAHFRNILDIVWISKFIKQLLVTTGHRLRRGKYRFPQKIGFMNEM